MATEQRTRRRRAAGGASTTLGMSGGDGLAVLYGLEFRASRSAWNIPECRWLVAADPAYSRMREVLSDLIALLSAANEGVYARRISSARDVLEESLGDRDREQATVRSILSLYGAMGSFQDLVLQDSNGVRPEQNGFDRLRSQLFDEAWAALG